MAYDPQKAGALCQSCPLYGNRVVPPEGPDDPEVAVIGEGPGFLEERKGRPFVGPSGLFLNDILKLRGLDRTKVLITNAVLCRAEVPDPNVQPKKKYDIPTYLAWLRKENARRKKMAKEGAKLPGAQPGEVPLLSDPFLCCHQRLVNELVWVDKVAKSRGRPEGGVYIPLGNKALEMVAGKTGIMKWRGSPLRPLWEQT